MQNLIPLQHNKNKCNLLQKQTQLKNKKTLWHPAQFTLTLNSKFKKAKHKIK